jgi:hypothetical protein
MSLWLTVPEVANKLNCSTQYVRYLISGRTRKYPNRIKQDSPVIPYNAINVIRYGNKIKYYIHVSAFENIKKMRDGRNK